MKITVDNAFKHLIVNNFLSQPDLVGSDLVSEDVLSRAEDRDVARARKKKIEQKSENGLLDGRTSKVGQIDLESKGPFTHNRESRNKLVRFA